MKMNKICLALIAACVGFSSCDDIFAEDEITTADVVDGLKTALKIGTDSSAAELGLHNGYYGNPLVKIPLPEEATKIMESMEFVRNLSPAAADVIDSKMESLVEAINRSAEDAAAEAKPIFTDAITNLSINDGWKILNGEVPNETLKSEGFDSLAATQYLKNQTYDALVDAYSPKMNAALDKKFVGNASAADLWNDIMSNYNGFVNQYGSAARLAAKLAGKDMPFNEVNTDIGEFVTGKALDGLFLKVGDQERAIRRDPFQWASDIIRKVFGSITTALKTDTTTTEKV